MQTQYLHTHYTSYLTTKKNTIYWIGYTVLLSSINLPTRHYIVRVYVGYRVDEMQGVVSQSYKYNEKISPELYVLNFVVCGINIYKFTNYDEDEIS